MEQPAEPAEPVDVESLRLQVRDALGQASECFRNGARFHGFYMDLNRFDWVLNG